MTDVIISEFIKVLTKAIKRYAKEFKLPEKDVQIVFSLNEKSENDYFVYTGFLPKIQVTFKKLLDVLVDFMGRDVFVPPAINKILLKLNEDFKLPPNEVRLIFIKRHDDEKKRIESILDKFKEEEHARSKSCALAGEDFVERDSPGVNKDYRICVYGKTDYIKDIYFNEIFSLLELA